VKLLDKEEFVKHIKKLYDESINILKTKNEDYSGSKTDPFINFKYVEKLGICSVEKGILTRVTDKLARINNLLEKKESVKDEKITDTISDMINYLGILHAWMSNKK
jgi:hypothetical protein